MAAATKAHGISVGLVSCACWENHVTLKFKKSGFLMVMVTLPMFLSILVPYLTVIVRGSMPPLLPFISQSGGEPPSSGMFEILALVGLYFSIFAFLTLFVSINHRNYKNYSLVRNINKIAFLLVSLSWLGAFLTICAPVGYTDLPNKFQWVVTVLFQHSLGASLFFGGLCVYQFLMIVVWWYLPDTSKAEKYTKLGFGCTYVLIFLISLYPLPAYIIEQLGPNPFDLQSMKNLTYSLPLTYTLVYMICSVCEWAVFILTTINFTIFYKDLQRVSFCVVFRHKSCMEEEKDITPSISLKIIS